jgi:hypothetical protein
MGKTGVVAVIPKDFSEAFPTMEKSLREKGMSMAPGTFKMYFPYKERNGYRRTGLDVNAQYIQNIKVPSEKEAEIRRVQALFDDLTERTGYDLKPKSQYWEEVFPVKLTDGDNMFDLDNPDRAIQFAWLKVHPLIARSMEGYMSGEYPPDTHFYIKDSDIEVQLAYNKKKTINTAIGKVEAFSLPKRRKVARLVGLPIDEETKEEIVYNSLDTFLHTTTIQEGPYKGQDSLMVFNSIVALDDEALEIRDLVNTLILKPLYREGAGGQIMEGNMVRFKSRTEMINHFSDPDKQGDLFEARQRLKIKEVA